jgi:hypothetical protein
MHPPFVRTRGIRVEGFATRRSREALAVPSTVLTGRTPDVDTTETSDSPVHVTVLGNS